MHYAFLTKNGPSFVVEIRDHYAYDAGVVVAIRDCATKKRARQIAQEHNAEPWNF